MSYREVGNVTGISHQTISNTIRGLTWPDLPQCSAQDEAVLNERRAAKQQRQSAVLV